LTLSPALAALLLKPRARGEAYDEALPRWGYALGGAALAWWLIAPALPEAWRDALGEARFWGWLAATALPGAVAGWCAGVPLDRVLRGFFTLFNLGFRATTGLYTRLVRLTLRGGGVAVMLVAYVVLVGTTGVGFAGVPKRFAAGAEKVQVGS